MQAAPAGKSSASWAFDLMVMGIGALLAAGAAVHFALFQTIDRGWLAACLLSVPLIVLLSLFPLRLSRNGVGIEVGFESAVLVALVVLREPMGALTIWALGQSVAQLTKRKRLDVRLFNVGLTVLCGTAAVVVMQVGDGLGRTSPAELLAVGAGCVVFFVLDLIVSAHSVAMEEGTTLWSQVRQSGGLLAGLVFVGIDSLGYLAALVGRALPSWASLLLAVPLATILIASQALSRAAEQRRRLTSLFDASGTIFGASSREEVLDLLAEHGKLVLDRPQTGLREEPPSDREVGAPVTGLPTPYWLVAPSSTLGRTDRELDHQALESLAGVGAQTFARLDLVAELGRQARTDLLTGLPNRLMFTDRLDAALLGASPRRQVAVLYLDLDGFKSVNDRFGHTAGDDLLRTVAERLTRVVGVRDCVARLGGDEFAVLLTDVAHVSEVKRVCTDVLAEVRGEAVVAGHSVTIGTSVGVVLSGGGDDAAEVMRNADMAMYSAKSLGKSQYRLYEESLGHRPHPAAGADRGPAHRHPGPTWWCTTSRWSTWRPAGSVGVEALVRWRRDGALVPPGPVHPGAEDSGLIVPLGQRVLAQVVADSAALVEAAGRPIDLAVNMSAHQLHDPTFVPRGAARRSTAFGVSRLVLEMTETVLVQDDPHTAATAGAAAAASAPGSRSTTSGSASPRSATCSTCRWTW